MRDEILSDIEARFCAKKEQDIIKLCSTCGHSSDYRKDHQYFGQFLYCYEFEDRVKPNFNAISCNKWEAKMDVKEHLGFEDIVQEGDDKNNSLKSVGTWCKEEPEHDYEEEPLFLVHIEDGMHAFQNIFDAYDFMKRDKIKRCILMFWHKNDSGWRQEAVIEFTEGI